MCLLHQQPHWLRPRPRIREQPLHGDSGGIIFTSCQKMILCTTDETPCVLRRWCCLLSIISWVVRHSRWWPWKASFKVKPSSTRGAIHVVYVTSLLIFVSSFLLLFIFSFPHYPAILYFHHDQCMFAWNFPISLEILQYSLFISWLNDFGFLRVSRAKANQPLPLLLLLALLALSVSICLYSNRSLAIVHPRFLGKSRFSSGKRCRQFFLDCFPFRSKCFGGVRLPLLLIPIARRLVQKWGKFSTFIFVSLPPIHFAWAFKNIEPFVDVHCSIIELVRNCPWFASACLFFNIYRKTRHCDMFAWSLFKFGLFFSKDF